MSVFEDVVLQTLRPRFRGQVLRPGDEGYDVARRVWNGMIDRSPGCIVRCTGTADVLSAVRFAREQGLEAAAIRGGGHNAAGLAVCDDGLVIDLSGMRGIRVDPARRTARAQGGATWGEFDRETQAFGLATTGGVISTTGVAGLTLGGGMGWLMRTYGLACDNLLSADVVTADGTVVVASRDENADLFWGLRGGGGNFGVVTSFEFQLHEVGSVLGGMLIYPRQHAKDVLRTFREVTASAPDDLTMTAGLLTSPDGVPVVAIPSCYHGRDGRGEDLLRPLRARGPVADLVAEIPYIALQSMLDDGFPAGMQVYWRGDFLTGIDDGLLDILIEHAAAAPSPLNAVLLEHMGGAVRRVSADDSAFGGRTADYNLAIIARWTRPEEADGQIAWTRRLHDAVRPFTTGAAYVNYLGVGEDAGRVRASYGPQSYGRLQAIKRKYDPENFFRYNQNIEPGA